MNINFYFHYLYREYLVRETIAILETFEVEFSEEINVLRWSPLSKKTIFVKWSVYVVSLAQKQ